MLGSVVTVVLSLGMAGASALSGEIGEAWAARPAIGVPAWVSGSRPTAIPSADANGTETPAGTRKETATPSRETRQTATPATPLK